MFNLVLITAEHWANTTTELKFITQNIKAPEPVGISYVHAEFLLYAPFHIFIPWNSSVILTSHHSVSEYPSAHPYTLPVFTTPNSLLCYQNLFLFFFVPFSSLWLIFERYKVSAGDLAVFCWRLLSTRKTHYLLVLSVHPLTSYSSKTLPVFSTAASFP